MEAANTGPSAEDMRYELMYIVPSTLTDDDVAGVEAQVKALLEKYGATLEDATRLGKFRLAYPIKKARHGHYNLAHFTAETSALAKIDEALRIAPNLLRHLVVREDEAGGAKFELVQFVEVNLDDKPDRPRRRTAKPEDGKPAAEGEAKSEAKEEKEADAPAEEDLDKKIDDALKGSAA